MQLSPKSRLILTCQKTDKMQMKMMILLLYKHFNSTQATALGQAPSFYLQDRKTPKKPTGAPGAPRLF